MREVLSGTIGQELQLVPEEQTMVFLGALALGAALGVLYDVLRILRLGLRHHPAVVFVEDVGFWCVVGLCAQLFLFYVDEGFFRLFVLVGMAIGFLLYHFTVGSLVMRVAAAIIDFLRRVGEFLWKKILIPIWGLGKMMFHKLGFIGAFIQEGKKKMKKTMGKPPKEAGKSENPLAK